MENMETSSTLLFSMIIVLCVCVLGLIGNCLSAVTLLQREMRSSTTYLLLGLTFSDTLLLILSFIRTLSNVHPVNLESSEGLKTFIFLWDWTCTSGTKYFTMAISFERYIAVCHPYKAMDWISEKRAKMFTLGIITFNMLLAVSSYFFKYTNSFGYEIYTAITLHFLPFVIVLVLNILIYFGIKEFQRTRKELTSADANAVSITNMLLCVVLVFGICYSFEFIRRILNYAGYFDAKYKYYDYTINHLADFFYVLNSSVNFIIYIWMGPKFRNQFLKIVKKVFNFVKPPRKSEEREISGYTYAHTKDDTVSNCN